MFFSMCIGISQALSSTAVRFHSFLERLLKHPVWLGISGAATVALLAFVIIDRPAPQKESAALHASRQLSEAVFPEAVSPDVVASEAVASDAIASDPAEVADPAAPARVEALAAAHDVGEFKIVSPGRDGIVSTESVLVSGVGGEPGGKIRIQIFTDRWYPQDMECQVPNGGAWMCGPIYLRGTGAYGSHTIRAQLVVRHAVLAEATVTGVRLARSYD